MQKWIFISGFIAICLPGFSQDNNAYINLYKDIAVSEMIRTGIPASIKLAQAILESNCGKSELACKANNHFGIKCGSDWNGKHFKKEDDDFENGQLVKSCFREFNSVSDSYIAHSDFLTDPGKAARYGSLFELGPTDYKSWAKGLSRAGYATDPQYATRLVDIIEKYELYRLDSEINRIEASASKKARSHYAVRYQNEVKYIVAEENDSPNSLAARLDISAREILRYNDGIENEKQILTKGSRVYLEPKQNKYKSKQQYHMMKEGEDMAAVSQKYGIKLSSLLKRNKLEGGQVPLPNQKVVLKGKLKKELRTVDPFAIPPRNNQLYDNNETAGKNTGKEVVDTKNVVTTKVIKQDTIKEKTLPPSSQNKGHVVSRGETLYGIAQSYGLSVDELKKMNNLSVDTIFVGQKLEIR